MQAFSPLAKGIQELPSKEPVYVPEKGVLSGLARDINHTSELLQLQQHQLERKETARANWIAGVSLNLASKLEYNMQSLHVEKINLLALIRQVSADFMNADMDGHYPIEFHTEHITRPCMINSKDA